MYTIRKEFHFSAAHRLEGHPKCGRLHGHNYAVVVEITGPALRRGMLIDYGDLSMVVKPIIEPFDHRYIVSQENADAEDKYADLAGELGHAIPLPKPASTAEYLAEHFAEKIREVLGHDGLTINVRVSETPKTSADYFG